MNVFLTGAAGFIGSHLAERLRARGDRVIGLDSFDPFYPRPVKERNLAGLRGDAGFTLIEGDLRAHVVDFDQHPGAAAVSGWLGWAAWAPPGPRWKS